jgi:hypothetical protein
LGNFVHSLRKSHRNGKLPDDRVRKLNKIGFRWNVKPVGIKSIGKKAKKRKHDETSNNNNQPRTVDLLVNPLVNRPKVDQIDKSSETILVDQTDKKKVGIKKI